MQIPAHYQTKFKIYLRFAIVMTIVALLLGISFQESAKKAPISEALPAGLHLEAVMNLALVHGHAFLIGVLIPLAVTWMLYLGLALGIPPISEKSLCWGTKLYLPASVLAIVLMLYKGYHLLIGVRTGHFDLAALNESFFFGSHALRAASYGIIHTAMAVGLGIIVISFWRNMGKSGQSAN